MNNVRAISQRLLIITLFAAASFFVSGTSQAATQELITNGGFEATPTDTGWTVSSGYPFSSVYHESGTHAAELAKDASPQSISQTVTVPQNIDSVRFTYRYGWIRTKQSAPAVDFDVRVTNVANPSEEWCVFTTPPQYQFPQGWYGKGNCAIAPSEVAGKTLRVQFTATEQFMDTHLELDRVSLAVTIDGIPPVTTVSTNPLPFHIALWRKGMRPVVTLAATDLRGVNATYYAWDNRPFTRYTSALTTPEGNGHQLSYYSVDQSGNRETTKYWKFAVDRTAPTTWATTLPRPTVAQHWIVSRTTKVLLTRRDNAEENGASTTYYAWDKGKYRLYKGAFAVPQKSGKHILAFYSVDWAGNKERTQRLHYKVR